MKTVRWQATVVLILALAAWPMIAVGQDGSNTPIPDSSTVEGNGSADSTETEAVARPRVSIAVSVESEEGQEKALGTLIIELHPEVAPRHVENFLKLVKEEFYDGTTFHRIVPAFIVQGGDLISKRNWKSSRLGTGQDGPDYTVSAEIGGKHVRGAIAAARQPDAVNPNRESSASQFYICLADLPALDRGGYSVFGKVVEGMEVVDTIARVKNSGPPQNQALQRVKIIQARLIKK